MFPVFTCTYYPYFATSSLQILLAPVYSFTYVANIVHETFRAFIQFAQFLLFLLYAQNVKLYFYNLLYNVFIFLLEVTMADMFQRSSPAMRFLSGLGTLIICNLLFIITSIPIFTIGASISAMYRITFELHMGRDPYVIKDYFRYFKENFKSSTIIWVPCLILATVWCASLYLVLKVLDPSYSFIQYPIYILLFCLVSVVIYAFPMIAVFEKNSSLQIVKNSILISIGNIPTTIFIIAQPVIIFLLSDFLQVLGVVFFSLFSFILFALDSWFFGFFINRAFKIEKPKEKLEED